MIPTKPTPRWPVVVGIVACVASFVGFRTYQGYYVAGNYMTAYRDKSALYGGNVKPGDPPSWP